MYIYFSKLNNIQHFIYQDEEAAAIKAKRLEEYAAKKAKSKLLDTTQ